LTPPIFEDNLPTLYIAHLNLYADIYTYTHTTYFILYIARELCYQIGYICCQQKLWWQVVLHSNYSILNPIESNGQTITSEHWKWMR
jgi:hypothetical protein